MNIVPVLNFNSISIVTQSFTARERERPAADDSHLIALDALACQPRNRHLPSGIQEALHHVWQLKKAGVCLDSLHHCNDPKPVSLALVNMVVLAGAASP